MVKTCPPEKILNPNTQRCIKRNGVTAKKLRLVSKSPNGSTKARKTLKTFAKAAKKVITMNRFNPKHAFDTDSGRLISNKTSKYVKIIEPFEKEELPSSILGFFSALYDDFTSLYDELTGRTVRYVNGLGQLVIVKKRDMDYVKYDKEMNPESKIHNLISSIDMDKIENIKIPSHFLLTGLHTGVYFLYLIQKYKNSCCILPDKSGEPYILFNNRTHKISYPFNNFDHLKKTMKRCESKKKRFIVFPLILTDDIEDLFNVDHVNIVILDLKKKTVEHFEPYGNIMRYDISLGFDIMIQFEKLSRSIGYEFIKNSDICPYYYNGPSKYLPGQLDERHMGWQEFNKKGQKGYCLAYSLMYMNMRLEKPDLLPIEVTQGLIRELKFKPEKMNTLIQNYAKFLNNFMKQFIKEYHKSKLSYDSEEYARTMNSPYLDNMLKTMHDQGNEHIAEGYYGFLMKKFLEIDEV